MSCVFDNTFGSPGPWTHAFLIGVGRYVNIEQSVRSLPLDLAQLPQLPEAWTSVRKIAGWLTNHANELTPPLGTLELLASQPGNPVFYNQQPLDSPTLHEVTQAYLRWDARLSEHADNQALFFFCGHGFLATGTLLLLDDVSNNPNDPFVEAIDFEGFWRGMQSRQVATQILIADSCQQVSHKILSQIAGSRGTSLAGGNIHQIYPRNALKLNAAAPGGSAWARAGQATEFTRALKRALEGRGAEQQPDGSWSITLSGLVSAVRVELIRAIRGGAPYQAPVPQTEGDSALTIRSLGGPPLVPVDLSLDPSVAVLDAGLTLEESSGAVRYQPPPGFPRPTDTAWKAEVEPDSYTARAAFADPQSAYHGRDRFAKVLCMPPRREFTLRI